MGLLHHAPPRGIVALPDSGGGKWGKSAIEAKGEGKQKGDI